MYSPRTWVDCECSDGLQRGECLLGPHVLAVLRPPGAETRPLPHPNHPPLLRQHPRTLPTRLLLAKTTRQHPEHNCAPQGLSKVSRSMLTKECCTIKMYLSLVK